MKRKPFFYTLILTIILTGLCMTPLVSASSGPYWTKSYPLSAGLGVMHEISVDGQAELVLHSPPGSNYDLYAMRNYGPFGSCPENSYIMGHADLSTAGMGSDVLILDSGLWCIVVQAQSGSGSYLLEAFSVISGGVHPEWGDFGDDLIPGDMPGDGVIPDVFDPDEPIPGEACTPYREIQYSGVMSAEAMSVEAVPAERLGGLNRSIEEEESFSGVFSFNRTLDLNRDYYSFEIGGSRSDVEVIALGGCGDGLPYRMLTDWEAATLMGHDCGTPLKLQIFKDCDPRVFPCFTAISVESSRSNSYYRLSNPAIGSKYYVAVIGDPSLIDEYDYRLIIRSYQC